MGNRPQVTLQNWVFAIRIDFEKLQGVTVVSIDFMGRFLESYLAVAMKTTVFFFFFSQVSIL